MTVELLPNGYRCNIRCEYCYQNPLRDSGAFLPMYNMEKMLAAIDYYKQPFTIFGGEPLLMKKEDLEKLWKVGLEKYKQNGIQSNGILITDWHWEAFKRYNVHVGFSIDGPNELNLARCGQQETDKACQNLYHALKHGYRCSLIVTLTKHNHNPRLINWLKFLESAGLRNARLHLLENDNADSLVIPHEELCEFLEDIYTTPWPKLKFDIFDDIENLLKGSHNACCVFRACDPYNTAAVTGVDGLGNIHNCGRTYHGGISYLKSSNMDTFRYHILSNTPQRDGGCFGCRFLDICTGFCPGTAINHDWRNRTEQCETLKFLYKMVEKKLGIFHQPNIKVKHVINPMDCGRAESDMGTEIASNTEGNPQNGVREGSRNCGCSSGGSCKNCGCAPTS